MHRHYGKARSSVWRQAPCWVLLALCALRAIAADIDALPDAQRDALDPVELNWAAMVPSLSGLAPLGSHAATLSQLSSWRAAAAAGELTEANAATWMATNKVDRNTLIRALDAIPLAHPMDEVYLPICAALYSDIGPDINGYLQFPRTARIAMATYLGALERPQDARQLLESVPVDEPRRMGMDLYHVANELMDWRRKSYDLAIWAFKRGATLRGPADKAFVCLHIGQACWKLYKQGDPSAYGEQLAPWAEEALTLPGSEARWGYAIPALVDAYYLSGQTDKAVERGLHHLKRLREHLVPPSAVGQAHYMVARYVAASGDVKQAADLYRTAIRHCPGQSWAQLAQAELLRLAEKHEEIGQFRLIEPELLRVAPERLVLLLGDDGSAKATVVCDGNATLEITKVTTDVDGLSVTQGEAKVVDTGRKLMVRIVKRCEIGVVLPEGVTPAKGQLVLHTNDPSRSVVVVPVMPATASPVEDDTPQGAPAAAQ